MLLTLFKEQKQVEEQVLVGGERPSKIDMGERPIFVFANIY